MNNEPTLPAESAFVSGEEAKLAVRTLIANTPSTTFSIGSLTKSNGDWEIYAKISMPRIATPNLLIDVPFLNREVSLILRGRANATTVLDDSTDEVSRLRAAHSYILLNGYFKPDLPPLQIARARQFRDKTLRSLYGSSIEHHDFDKILAAIRSELTGTAFE